MAAVSFSPIGNGVSFLGVSLVLLNGGQLFTYQAGTSTPQATYTTNAGSIANANPIILGSDGRAPNEIWLVQGQAYKFVLFDAQSNLIATYDNVSGIDSGLRADLANTSNTALGDALIGVKRTLTGAIATNLHNYLDGSELNAKRDFGATGNGSTDDTAALQAAFAAAAGTMLLLPPGIYKHTELTAPDAAFALIGYGTDLSVLRYMGTTIGITYTSTDILKSFTMKGITLEAGNAAGFSGLALQIFYPTTTSFAGKTVTLENIEISSSVTGPALPAWSAGVYMKNAWNAKIDNLFIRGQANTTTSSYGVKLGENCTGVKFKSTNIIWFTDAVLVEAYLEGLVIEQSDFTDCIYGVRNTNTSTGFLELALDDTHLNCQTRNLLLTNVGQILVNNCLIYTSNTLASPAHFELVSCLFPHITGTHFACGSIAPVASIVLTGVAYANILGNTFDNLQASPAVLLDATSSGNNVGNNTDVAGNALVNQYIDLGTNNYIDTLMANARAPGKDIAYDLGASAYRWRRLYTGGLSLQALRKSTNYTVLVSDSVITVDTGAGNVTITLPASPTQGMVFIVYKEFAANTLTVSGGANNIDNGGTSVAYTAVNAVGRFIFVGGYGWIRA